MSEDKYIAEMAVKCCVRNPRAHTVEECLECEFKHGMCGEYKLAKTLYEEGYRKIYDDYQRQCTCYALGCQMAEELKRGLTTHIFIDINNMFEKINYRITDGLFTATMKQDEESQKLYTQAQSIVNTIRDCIRYTIRDRYIKDGNTKDWTPPTWTSEMWKDFGKDLQNK